MNFSRRILSNPYSFLASVAIFLSHLGYAEAVTTWKPQDSKVEVSIGYTLGTHELKSTSMNGALTQPDVSLESISGELLVPIRDLKEGNAKLECHMLSSLGVDYSKSKFPGEHVCDSDNRLPESGPDSVIYPNIVLKIERLKKVSEDQYEVEGQWIIHGVSQKITSLRMKLEERGDEMISSGKTQFRLSDFGVVVKRAFVISVSETAAMKWSVAFKRSRGEQL